MQQKIAATAIVAQSASLRERSAVRAGISLQGAKTKVSEFLVRSETVTSRDCRERPLQNGTFDNGA
jgi:hypothetical protein